MIRRLLKEHLAMAEKHVALGEEHLVRLRSIVGELRRHGYDTTQDEMLLASFEAMQVIHLEHRNRLRLELHSLKP
jgi:hypothetical protein